MCTTSVEAQREQAYWRRKGTHTINAVLTLAGQGWARTDGATWIGA